MFDVLAMTSTRKNEIGEMYFRSIFSSAEYFAWIEMDMTVNVITVETKQTKNESETVRAGRYYACSYPYLVCLHRYANPVETMLVHVYEFLV